MRSAVFWSLTLLMLPVITVWTLVLIAMTISETLFDKIDRKFL